jgi:hypothetical protein
MANKPLQLLGICGVYCGACTTFRAYNDKDQDLVKWEIKMGMPRDEIICKGCRSELLNKWCSDCKFRKCVKNKGVNNCFECRFFPLQKTCGLQQDKTPQTIGPQKPHAAQGQEHREMVERTRKTVELLFLRKKTTLVHRKLPNVQNKILQCD